MTTVLLVDDELAQSETLDRHLRAEGFVTVRARDGRAAIDLFEQRQPDLVVLDLDLPIIPGSEVMRRMRTLRDVPVIILTARVDEVDRIVGLELGADDYVGKPFSPREVVARVKCILRRSERVSPAGAPTKRRVGAITIDSGAHEVHVNGNRVELTPTQFRILETLAANVGQALTRDRLLESVRISGDVFDRTLDRHIANLRARIEADPAKPRLIVTVTGIGYKLIGGP